MNTEQYVEAIDTLPIEVVQEHFEALFVLALSIEESEQDDDEQ
jgi:hypothetical protein